MMYILLIDDNSTMEFWVLSCAELYQSTLGGVIYAVDISRPIDRLTDQTTAQLDA